MLSGKFLKLFITFPLDISPDSALFPISRVLRNRRLSESESVSKVLPPVRCVPMIITSSLFIRFEHTSNDWKVVKVSYELGIAGLLR